MRQNFSEFAEFRLSCKVWFHLWLTVVLCWSWLTCIQSNSMVETRKTFPNSLQSLNYFTMLFLPVAFLNQVQRSVKILL